MAITANTVTLQTPPGGGTDWVVSAYSADLSGCESLKAAATGKVHYVQRIIVMAQSETDVTVTIGEGETSSAVTTTLLGPIPMGDVGRSIEFDFRPKGIKLTAATALTIDASAACPIAVFAEGKTCTS